MKRNNEYERIMKMSRKELSKEVQRLSKNANRRLQSFERHGENSPAYNYIQDSGGKFKTRGKTLNQLRAEYRRVSGFLESKTGTLKGTKNWKIESISKLNKKLNLEGDRAVTLKDFDTIWEAYEKLKELTPEIRVAKYKYTMGQGLDSIADMVVNNPDLSGEDIAFAISEKVKEADKKIFEKG